MAWASTGRKNSAGITTGTACNVTLNSTVAGNMIVVVASLWASGGSPTATCSDDVNGSYGTAIITQVASQIRVYIWVKPNIAGGNVTVTTTASASGWTWAAVHEFSGGVTASPTSGTPGSASGSTTPGSSGSTTPADADCLVVAACSLNTGSAITENAGGQGYTLSNEMEDPPGTGQPGSFVYKILSGGSGVAQSHTWSFAGASPTNCGVIAAFKPQVGPTYAQTKFRVYNDDGTGLGEAA